MSATTPPTYADILAAVAAWPAAQRYALVNDVLQTLVPEPITQDARRAALRRLDGILASAESLPSDEDVRRWLEEQRMEKYG